MNQPLLKGLNDLLNRFVNFPKEAQMTRKKLLLGCILSSFCLSILLLGCSPEKKEEVEKKETLQQELGQKAAEEIQKPLEHAQQAAELQESADKQIQEVEKKTRPKMDLEGC